MLKSGVRLSQVPPFQDLCCIFCAFKHKVTTNKSRKSLRYKFQVFEIFEWSNESRHMVETQAFKDDEGRRYRRYASGSWQQAQIRRFPNGATPQNKLLNSQVTLRKRGELKHLSNRRKRKQKRFPKQRRAEWEQPKPILWIGVVGKHFSKFITCVLLLLFCVSKRQKQEQARATANQTKRLKPAPQMVKVQQLNFGYFFVLSRVAWGTWNPV